MSGANSGELVIIGSMPEECKDHEREAEQAGDRYYRAVTSWLTSRQRPDEERQRAFVLARVYYRSLDLLQECLERIHDRPGGRRKMEQAAVLQEHLKHDIEALSSTGLKSQTDEM